MTYQEEAASGSNNVWFGIEWSESNAATTFSITPKIYRWDRQNTDNSGGRWSEDLTEPSGSTGSWSGLKFGSGSGYRVIDTLAKRTYTKTHSARTITYHLRTDANFGTYYNGWTTLGAQTWTFTMTVPAKASYAVTYYNNGGGTAPSAQTKWYGEDLTLNGAITNRTNYVFKNWNTKADGSGTAYAAGAKYTGNAALALYAQWYAPYTITPNANGGTLKSGCSALTKVYNTAKAIWASSLNPTRTGYTFTGWNTKADGTGTSYSAGANYSTNANATLYAQWRINTWAVTYNGNGSTGGSTAAQTKTYGQSLALQQNGFTRTGYNFVNWNTKADGSGTGYNAGASYTGNAALTLYAQWKVAHSNPTISSLSVKRCASDGTEDVEGAYMKVDATWSVDNTTTGFEDTVGSTFEVTLDGTTDTVNLSGTSGTVSFVHSKTALITSSYKVTSVLADSKGYTTTRTSSLSVAFFTMHFKAGGKGVGIGKPSSVDNLLDVGMNTKVTGTFDATGKITSTGDVQGNNLQAVSGGAYLNEPTADISTATNGVSGNVYRTFGTRDKNGQYASYIETTIKPNGSIGLSVRARNRGTGSNVDNGVAFDIANDGTRTVSVSDVNAWRNGIGALGATTANGYEGMITRAGADNVWIRTTQNGLIPYASGGASSSLGTSSWAFKEVWAKKVSGFRTQLYNNATGTDGTVTLSASAANYNHLIIYYKKNGDANACGSTVVYSPNGKKASLMVANYSSSTHQIMEKIVTISGTSITKTSEGYVNYQASNTGWNSGTTDTTLYIYRVEGWNE